MKEIVSRLEESIRGEIEANYKYRLFSEKAREEDYPTIASLFKASSMAEEVHFSNHLKALLSITGEERDISEFQMDKAAIKEQIKSTKINLLNARVSESFEYKEKYKNHSKLAIKLGYKEAERTFVYARMAEKIHSKLFNQFLKLINNNKTVPDHQFYVCQRCGNIELDKVPVKCPICKSSSESYSHREF